MVLLRNQFVILLVTACINPISNRKYDIESECQKIYGQSLNNVLQIFRRSPEYLKILKLKKGEVLEEFYDIYHTAKVIFDQRMKNKTKAILKSMETKDLETTTQADARRRRNKLPDDEKPEVGIAVSNNSAKTFRRNELSPIDMLDLYPHLVSSLSVDEKKAFANLGFEMAGEFIHFLKSSIYRDDLLETEASTQYDGVDADSTGVTTTTTTTEHPKRHTIPDIPETKPVADDDEVKTTTFRIPAELSTLSPGLLQRADGY